VAARHAEEKVWPAASGWPLATARPAHNKQAAWMGEDARIAVGPFLGRAHVPVVMNKKLNRFPDSLL
jgi:hypothetical protein